MNGIHDDEKESAKTKLHGWGKYTFADGSVYQGGWNEDKTNGWGKLRYVDGTVYVGNWGDYKRNGWCENIGETRD
jgi:hypothetical protein